jgi:hypothetical protein
MGRPCRTVQNEGVCPKKGDVIQFSAAYQGKYPHLAARAQRERLSLLFLVPRFFFAQRWELVGIRHLLMQEAGDFNDRHPEFIL